MAEEENIYDEIEIEVRFPPPAFSVDHPNALTHRT